MHQIFSVDRLTADDKTDFWHLAEGRGLQGGQIFENLTATPFELRNDIFMVIGMGCFLAVEHDPNPKAG